MVHDEWLGVHDCREPWYSECLGGVGRHEQDVGPRGDGVRPLDIQAGLQRPDVACLLACAVAARRRRLDLGHAVPEDVLERRHVRGTGHARLTAHVRQAHLGVEISQVRRHVRVAERVDDGDGHALALVLRRVKRGQVVGGLHGLRGEAAPADREAVRLTWRCDAAIEELILNDAGRGLWQIAHATDAGARWPEPQRRRTGEGERYSPASRLTYVLMKPASLHPPYWPAIVIH